MYSTELQLLLELESTVRVCGKTLVSTKQGVYFRSTSGLLRRRVRYIDAAEKNLILTAAQVHANEAIERLHRLQCVNDVLLVSYLMEMGKSNPSRLARAYLARNGAAAKFQGDALLIWECAKVEVHSINYSHYKDNVCYDPLPVSYGWGKKMVDGFIDSTTWGVFQCRHRMIVRPQQATYMKLTDR